MASPLFGVFFVGNSYPIFESVFLRPDPAHWVLDVITTVTSNYETLQEISIFLCQSNVLPQDAALGLYICVGGGDWLYRGFVSSHCPTAVMPLAWPEQAPISKATMGPGSVQIGVSLETYEELKAKEGSRIAGRQEFVKRVALDLFHFMESFHVGAAGDKLIVPANAIDLWIGKIAHKLEKDPDFLLHGDKSS